MSVTTAVITCPLRGAKPEALMPEDACQFFWDRPGCGGVLRPKAREQHDPDTRMIDRIASRW